LQVTFGYHEPIGDEITASTFIASLGSTWAYEVGDAVWRLFEQRVKPRHVYCCPAPNLSLHF